MGALLKLQLFLYKIPAWLQNPVNQADLVEAGCSKWPAAKGILQVGQRYSEA